MQKALLPRIEDVVEKEEKVSHEKLAEEAEADFGDPKKVGLKARARVQGRSCAYFASRHRRVVWVCVMAWGVFAGEDRQGMAGVDQSVREGLRGGFSSKRKRNEAEVPYMHDILWLADSRVKKGEESQPILAHALCGIL
eukprot:167267-Pleurochrysis_carterae.AAC.1